jgi:hypothetical protein
MPGTIQFGSRGSEVQQAQRLLNTKTMPPPRLAVDGIFGPLTEAATRSFQKQKRILVDGIIGPQTWGKLLENGAGNGSGGPSKGSTKPQKSGVENGEFFGGKGKRAALLTCVGNYKGIGPGHSAIVVDYYVYTFEKVVGAWRVPDVSGWRMVDAKTYFEANTNRPVVVQELSQGRTDATEILHYIYTSNLRDDDYLDAGLCCYQAAKAVGMGINRVCLAAAVPMEVYGWLQRTGTVSDCYTAYPPREPDNPAFAIQMKVWYPAANKSWLYPAPASLWPMYWTPPDLGYSR